MIKHLIDLETQFCIDIFHAISILLLILFVYIFEYWKIHWKITNMKFCEICILIKFQVNQSR